MIPFPDKKYQIIYADPAWDLQDLQFHKKWRPSIKDKYDTMPTADIHALPVESIAEDDAWLYLWVVDSLLPECIETVSCRGFEYRRSFIWDKQSIGLGIYNRGQHEQLLMARRGSPQCLISMTFHPLCYLSNEVRIQASPNNSGQ